MTNTATDPYSWDKVPFRLAIIGFELDSLGSDKVVYWRAPADTRKVIRATRFFDGSGWLIEFHANPFEWSPEATIEDQECVLQIPGDIPDRVALAIIDSVKGNA